MSCENFITPYVGLDETEQQTNCSIAVIGVCVFFSQLRDADPDCVNSSDSPACSARECGMEGIPQGEHGGVP